MGTITMDSTAQLERYLATHEIVDITDDDVIIMAERAQSQDLRELGASGGSAYNHYVLGDYNPMLTGYSGLKKYKEMRTDAQVRSSLRIVKTPVLDGRWFVEAREPTPLQERMAEFVWWNLEEGMSVSWMQMLLEALLMLDYGHYVFEIVYENRDTPFGFRTVWKKFAPRHPANILEWGYDEGGGPTGMWFAKPDAPSGRVWIPIEKLLIFTFDREDGGLEGQSILRSAYPHWYYKTNLYKIDAIQKERHGIGIPVVKLPPGYDDEDKRLAKEMASNLRTNENSHVALPPNWEVFFLKLEGQAVNALESAEHHGRLIYENVLAHMMTSSGGESAAATAPQDAMFGKGTRFIAEIVRDMINKYAIPKLIAYNWDSIHYPRLRVRRIGDVTDMRTLSFALRNLVGANIVRVDDELEAWVREELDLPRVDEDTLREVPAPQSPGGARVGPPRQSTARGMRSAQNAGGANVGGDNSGG